MNAKPIPPECARRILHRVRLGDLVADSLVDVEGLPEAHRELARNAYQFQAATASVLKEGKTRVYGPAT